MHRKNCRGLAPGTRLAHRHRGLDLLYMARRSGLLFGAAGPGFEELVFAIDQGVDVVRG